MASGSQRQEGSNSILPALNVAIEALNTAKEISAITPAKAAFGSVSALLARSPDTRALYSVLIHRLAILLNASFRRRLAAAASRTPMLRLYPPPVPASVADADREVGQVIRSY